MSITPEEDYFREFFKRKKQLAATAGKLARDTLDAAEEQGIDVTELIARICEGYANRTAQKYDGYDLGYAKGLSDRAVEEMRRQERV